MVKLRLLSLFTVVLLSHAAVAQSINSSGAVSGAPSGAAGGDLSGTFPNPTVAKVGGAAIPNGIAKGNGTSLSAAVANTDYNAWGGVTLTATPANPTGTSSLTATMAGLGSTCTITPTNSTRLFIVVNGTISNNTASDGGRVQIRYGTGTAPVNAATLTGTALGNSSDGLDGGANGRTGFSVAGIATGLTKGTAVWIDLSQVVLTGGTATLLQVTCTAFEM